MPEASVWGFSADRSHNIGKIGLSLYRSEASRTSTTGGPGFSLCPGAPLTHGNGPNVREEVCIPVALVVVLGVPHEGVGGESPGIADLLI